MKPTSRRPLSPAMRRDLLFVAQVYAGPHVRCGRPTLAANLATHNALLRRGLIHEADDSFHTVTLTERGRLEVVRLRELGYQ